MFYLSMIVGSIVWLSPFYEVFKDEIIVYTPNRNYTAKDLVDLYNDASSPVPATIMGDIKSFLHYDAPGVPTNCIMGNNKTPKNFKNFEI